MKLVHIAHAAAFFLPVCHVTVAFAQGTTVVPVQVPIAPPSQPPSQGPVGGGNAEYSSSKPGARDGFDFNYGSASQNSVRGTSDGPVFTGRYGASVPPTHQVKRGDTLSSLSDYYFRSPWSWPKLWSYNPQIQNPNWIYPGDIVRLKAGAQYTAMGGSGFALTDRRRVVGTGTVFVRDGGFIEDGGDEDWGELTGSPRDKMMLGPEDTVYLRVGKNRELSLGQELTIFRPVRTTPQGKIVQIQGTLRILSYNPKEGFATARIREAMEVIERGARVGNVERRFAIVPPRRNEKDFVSHVITSVYPHNFWGQNQVVFIAKGEADGLKTGNRFFVIRKGDAWRRSLVSPGAGNRISPSSERLPEIESTPGGGDEKLYPDEVVAELRVVSVRKNTAACLVTLAKQEIERGDVVVARRGY